MDKFIEKVDRICRENKKVAMFIDMDGTIVEYVIYGSEKELINSKNNFLNANPIDIIIDKLRKINEIDNIHFDISKNNKNRRRKKAMVKK